MGKQVGMAEFKAHCTRLLRELEQDGEPITITNRGRAVAVVTPSTAPETPPLASAFGCMKGTGTIIGDIESPIDPDWEAKWEAKWDELGFPAPTR